MPPARWTLGSCSWLLQLLALTQLPDSQPNRGAGHATGAQLYQAARPHRPCCTSACVDKAYSTVAETNMLASAHRLPSMQSTVQACSRAEMLSFLAWCRLRSQLCGGAGAWLPGLRRPGV